MRQNMGVPASQSGHSRAEPEEVSVVPTSVPNALGVVIFPRLAADAVTFESKPWKLSDKARLAIEKIEAEQRRAWREVMCGNFWLD